MYSVNDVEGVQDKLYIIVQIWIRSVHAERNVRDTRSGVSVHDTCIIYIVYISANKIQIFPVSIYKKR